MSLSIPADKDILVCIFQRGAADGLNSVVPYGDNDYIVHRPSIFVPNPGAVGGAIDLDGFFGLNPALADLKTIYDANDLAFVHATGIPHGSRSHFSAQGLVERGITEISGASTGWIGRYLNATAASSNSAFRAVAIAGNVPVSLLGATDPLAISELSAFALDQGLVGTDYPNLLENMYANEVPFSQTANAALSAMDELNQANISSITPQNGATYPSGALGNRLQQAAQLIYSDIPVEVICIDSDNWDHHENLTNYLNASLVELNNALFAFYTDLGTEMRRVTVVVMTEFGRRVFENGSNGTDHGTGSCAYVMGGGVNGGQVFSNWPGLDIPNLALGEDLAITTDLRSVILEMLEKRLDGSANGSIFPGYTDTTNNNIFSI